MYLLDNDAERYDDEEEEEEKECGKRPHILCIKCYTAVKKLLMNYIYESHHELFSSRVFGCGVDILMFYLYLNRSVPTIQKLYLYIYNC